MSFKPARDRRALGRAAGAETVQYQDFPMPNGMQVSVGKRGPKGSDGWQEWRFRLAEREGGPVVTTDGIRISQERSAKDVAQTFAAIYMNICRDRDTAPYDRPWLTPDVVQAFRTFWDQLETRNDG